MLHLLKNVYRQVPALHRTSRAHRRQKLRSGCAPPESAADKIAKRLLGYLKEQVWIFIY